MYDSGTLTFEEGVMLNGCEPHLPAKAGAQMNDEKEMP
jgi:hypothetical protein